MGPLFQAIMVNQFTRLRDGDRFFYLNENFNPEEMSILRGANTLTDVIEANTNVTNLQSDAFLFRAFISGTVTLNSSGGGGGTYTPWASPAWSGGPGGGGGSMSMGGYTLKLEDASGNVLATTVTDARGHYTFTQQSGPAANPDIAYGVSAVGTYQVVLVVPHGAKQTSPSPQPITIDVGNTNVTGVDFTLALSGNRWWNWQ